MNPTNTTEQQNRIASLKRQIREVTGQDPILHPGTPGRSLPLDMEEQFLRRILEFESAAKSRPIDHLKKAGIPVTEPGELEDGAVHSALWEVLQGLAELHMFFTSTDHLSDRELYQKLWNDVLLQPTEMFSPEGHGAWHYDLCESGQEDAYLRYYADDFEREEWSGNFPDENLPPKESLPYDRDRFLPKP